MLYDRFKPDIPGLYDRFKSAILTTQARLFVRVKYRVCTKQRCLLGLGPKRLDWLDYGYEGWTRCTINEIQEIDAYQGLEHAQSNIPACIKELEDSVRERYER
jgi:hypothetical protein